MKRLSLSWFVLFVLSAGLWSCGRAPTDVGPVGAQARAAPKDAPSATTRPATTRPATTTATAPAHRLKGRALLRRKIRINKKLVKLFRAGKYAECERLIGELLRLDPNDYLAWYNLACVHSRLGRPQRALACLNTALAKGYSDFRHMQRDPDLAALRDTAEYRAILARNEQVQRRRAERIRDALRRRFGAGTICRVDHANKLVFATTIDAQTLEELRRHITALAEGLWNDLFTYRFEQYVTIVVPAAGAQIRLPGGARVPGYYTHGQRLLVARQIGMVMNHEFTHALHDADQDGLGQRHPIWITEGLATLYESSKVRDGHVIPLPNHRLNLLKRLLARKRTIPWKHLFNYTQANFMSKALISYSECRYIMMYLYQRGLLRKWYEQYTQDYATDRSGRLAMEKVFGQPLEKIEADWKRWVRRLPAPPLRIAPGGAYIGVRVASQTDGLRIVAVVPGSGADKAGLKSGDVIVGLDGQRVVDRDALIRFVASRQVGDEVSVRFRRNGHYATTAVVLQPMPEAPLHMRPKATSRPARHPARGRRPARRGRRPSTAPTTRPSRRAA